MTKQTPGQAFREAILDRYEPDSASAIRVLDLAADTLDEITALEEEVAKMGLVVLGSKGQPAANPLLRELRAHRDAFLRLSASLEPGGDKPVSRQAAAALARKRWGK